MSTLFDFLDGQISGVVERGLPTHFNQREFFDQRIAVLAFGQQMRALIEADEEEIVVAVRGLNEGFERVPGAVELAFHASRHVEDDSQVEWYVFFAEVRYGLFDTSFEKIEVLFA